MHGIKREAEKIYRGRRTVFGAQVTVNGSPLKHIECHSPTGFEWGYGGNGPADLAFSILADLYNENRAKQLYQNFKWSVIAGLRGDSWQLTERHISDWVVRNV